MDTERDGATDFRERFFKNAAAAATPWGIAKNWLLIGRMLVILVGEALWSCLPLLVRCIRMFFSRRLRRQMRLYSEASQAGSPETEGLQGAMAQEIGAVLFPEHRKT